MQTSIRAQTRVDGIWLPLITPFRDGELDERAIASLASHYAASSIDGLIVAATTGEGLTLSPEETVRLTLVTAEATAGRLPILLGLCGSDTRTLVRRLADTRHLPIDGYLIACPYYSRPSQDGLRRHFTELAAHSAKPIVVYNILYRTGVNLANETLLELAGLQNIIGVKDCCASMIQSFDLIRARPPGFSVMTGEDALFFNAIAQGAHGGILASAHIDPEAFAVIRRAYLAGDHDEALRRWQALIDIVTLLFAEPNPAPIKHWLWREGRIPSPELRLPMTSVSDRLAARIDEAIARRRGEITLSPVTEDIHPAVLDLNNAHEVELSCLAADRLPSLLAQACYARRIGAVDAFLLAFDEGAYYDSPNYRWFRERYPRFVYVDRVVVAAQARGRGYARRLYADLLEHAKAAGHPFIVCEVNSDPPNPASDRLHASLGFIEVGQAALHGGERTVRYLAREIRE